MPHGSYGPETGTAAKRGREEREIDRVSSRISWLGGRRGSIISTMYSYYMQVGWLRFNGQFQCVYSLILVG